MTKTYADTCLERASRATEGPWDTLGEDNEVHAISFIDHAGDPLHIIESIDKKEDAEFIAAARFDVVELAQRLKKACAYLTDEGMGWLVDELEAMPEKK